MLFCRQPIFEARMRVWGYELAASSGPLPGLEDGLSPSLPHLAPGKALWLRVTPAFLREVPPGLLPPAPVILEIPAEDARALEGGEVLQTWTRAGHRLASLWTGAPTDKIPLPAGTALVKVDFPRLPAPEREQVFSWAARQRLQVVAARLESLQHFREAVAAGCAYAQGSFYRRREEGSASPARRFAVNYVTILNELGQTPLNFPRFAALIQSNPPLVHRLLHYLNSAFFGLPCRVHSVEQALLLLGEEELRKWAALVIIHHLGEAHPEELFLLSLIRARLAERLGAAAGLGSGAGLFLAGLLSLLDLYLGMPLEELLAEMPLSPLIREILLGVPGPSRQVLELILALEDMAWGQARQLARGLNLSEEAITAAYLEALESTEASRSLWLT